MKVIVDVPNWLYAAMLDHEEPRYSHSLGDAVRDELAIPIPNNATNGDVIMLMFPNGDLHDYDYYDGYVIYELNYMDFKFDKTWWNSPYKRE